MVGNNWERIVTLSEEQVLHSRKFGLFLGSSSNANFHFSAEAGDIWGAQIDVWNKSCYARRGSCP